MDSFKQYLETAADSANRELYKTRAASATGYQDFRRQQDIKPQSQPGTFKDTSGIANRDLYGPGDYNLNDPDWFDKMYGRKIPRTSYSYRDADTEKKMARRAKWDKPYLGDDPDTEYGLDKELASQRDQENKARAWPPSPEDVANAKPFGTDRDVWGDMMNTLDARRGKGRATPQQAQEIKRLSQEKGFSPQGIAMTLGIPMRHVRQVLAI